MSKNITITKINKNQDDINMIFIEKYYKKEYPNMPIHKYNRLMREYKNIDKSDWLEGEIFIPQNFPKDFWDFTRF